MLEERETYYFKVKKEVTIPGMPNQYVMQASDGKKHLMPSEPYKSYPFNIGDKIKCYVDKINCVGKVFLEPEHPYYRRGAYYNFKIKFISEPYYKRGKYRRKLFIKDNRSSLIEAIPYKFNFDIDFSKQQKCKIIKLKKGKVVISNSTNSQ